MKDESDSDIDSSSESCELDFTSTNFNPSKVLRSVSIQIPCPNAPIFDNIHSYASHHIHHRHASKQVKANSGEQPSTSGSQDAPQLSRRFLPHQEPVLAPRKQRPERNLLTRMRNTTTGPLARLRDCTELRVRVKVYIRNMKGIRGYCIAFVAAFDKHWNLALEDVTEVWTRPVKRKAVALVGPSPELQVQPSRVQVVKKDRRTETCERHVSQLMVRGEQVALIAILD